MGDDEQIVDFEGGGYSGGAGDAPYEGFSPNPYPQFVDRVTPDPIGQAIISLPFAVGAAGVEAAVGAATFAHALGGELVGEAVTMGGELLSEAFDSEGSEDSSRPAGQAAASGAANDLDGGLPPGGV